MPSDDEILAKYGANDSSAPDPDAAILAKYGAASPSEPDVKGPDISPLETFTAHATNPLGFGKTLYGVGNGAYEAGSAIPSTLKKYGLTTEAIKRLKDRYQSGHQTGTDAWNYMSNANPKSALAGGITNAVGTAALTAGAGAPATLAGKVAQGTAMGGAYGFGNSNADLTKGQFKRAGIDTGVGMGLGAGFTLAGAGLKAASDKSGLTNYLASNALGGTRAQMEPLEDDIGTQLLQRGAVKPFYGPTQIGNKAEKIAMEGAGKINSSLSAMDEAGARLSPEDLQNSVDAQGNLLTQRFGSAYKPAAENARTTLKENVLPHLSGGAEGDGAAKITQGGALTNEDINLIKTMQTAREQSSTPIPLTEEEKSLISRIFPVSGQEGGEAPSFPLSVVEKEKRGYGQLMRDRDWLQTTPSQQKEGTKALYRGLKNAVEEKAQSADPELAQQFMQGKQDFGTFAPAAEVAGKRSLQLQQHPWGGFLDMTTGAMEMAHSGNPLYSAAAMLGRKVVAPRITSTLAHGLYNGPLYGQAAGRVTQQQVSQLQKPETVISRLSQNPATQHYASALQDAAGKGDETFAARYYLLSQSYPDFREAMEGKQ